MARARASKFCGVSCVQFGSLIQFGVAHLGRVRATRADPGCLQFITAHFLSKVARMGAVDHVIDRVGRGGVVDLFDGGPQ